MKYDNLLHEYAQGVTLLTSTLAPIPEAYYTLRPQRPNAWTIAEHIIHLVDSEINGFIRCKSIVAQPGSTCYVMDELLWTKNLQRKNEKVATYIELFKILRTLMHDFCKDEPEELWENNYFIRTYNGETKHLTLKDCITLYTTHVSFHITYIKDIHNWILSQS